MGLKAMKLTRVFIHGLESSGQGTKGVFFRERYPDMIIEDYFGSFSQRMEKLEGLLAREGPSYPRRIQLRRADGRRLCVGEGYLRWVTGQVLRF